MKASDIIELNESVTTILDSIHNQCDKDEHRDASAKHLATLMVLRDMDKRYSEEAHPLKSNTYLDYLFGDGKTTKRALEAFHTRIQENPRARNLLKKYVEQFMDYSYGPTAMRTRIESLRKHFDARREQRTKWHEEQVVTNFNTAQDKLRADYQQTETK